MQERHSYTNKKKNWKAGWKNTCINVGGGGGREASGQEKEGRAKKSINQVSDLFSLLF